MKWDLKGPRYPPKDEEGVFIWQLWRICNKYTIDGEPFYGVQYWESEGANLVYAVNAWDVLGKYPQQADGWEKKFSKSWTSRYPNGNEWNGDERNPIKRPRDTPGKTVSKPKRQRSFNTEMTDEIVPLDKFGMKLHLIITKHLGDLQLFQQRRKVLDTLPGPLKQSRRGFLR